MKVLCVKTNLSTKLLGMVGLLASAFSLGCGGESLPENMPKLEKVSVKVTHNGSPVEGATVLFAPDLGQYSASAVTDATGVAPLKTEGEYTGAVAGSYKVSVTKMERLAYDTGPTPTNPKEYAEYEARLKKLPKPKNLLPEKYSNFAKSGLTATVSSGATAPIEIDLK